MKTIILTDVGKRNLPVLVTGIKDYQERVRLIDTESCSEEKEEETILSEAETFSDSFLDVLIVEFSGREHVAQRVGDERPELVVTISNNQSSRFYIERPIDNILELIKKNGD